MGSASARLVLLLAVVCVPTLGAHGSDPASVAASPPPESRLENGRFDTEAQLAGWDLGNAAATWSSLDVEERAGSGSALIENASPVSGFSFEISQCVPTQPGPHAVGASYRIPGGQAPATGDAGVRWFFHAGAGCDPGAFLDASQISTENIVVVPDVWGELAVEDVQAPPGTGSVRFYLVNRRESTEGTFVVHFDDAYLVPEPTLRASACCGLLALAGLAALAPARATRL